MECSLMRKPKPTGLHLLIEIVSIRQSNGSGDIIKA